MTRLRCVAVALIAVSAHAQDESAYYTVDHLVPPDGERLEVGGLDFLPDGRLVCSTRRGQVWMVERPLGGWPAGYEAQVNSTHSDPVKTGSLYNLDKVLTRLVPPDTWFTQHVICREEPEGTRITIRVNGVVVVDHLDRERRHASGHVAFQQHHEGSVVHYRHLAVREMAR